jgi:hypothetical protein
MTTRVLISCWSAGILWPHSPLPEAPMNKKYQVRLTPEERKHLTR